MRLIHLNKELDIIREHELFSDNKNGFKVTIIYKKDSWMSLNEGKKVIEVYNNCTEVHYLYSPIIGMPRKERKIAFESDIHHTGCNRSVDDLESVNIETNF